MHRRVLPSYGHREQSQIVSRPDCLVYCRDRLISLVSPSSVRRASRNPSTMADCSEFFLKNKPCAGFEERSDKIKYFCDHHLAEASRVVLVTAGGTTVPLEQKTVRFVDNFSLGNRGAASAEYFLRAGYAVIFMHRQNSLEPFSRNIHSNVLDLFSTRSGALEISENVRGLIENQVKRYEAAVAEKKLLKVSFTTVADYLFLLRAAAQHLAPLGGRAMLYLAAAVSDFYVHPEKLSEHKISSDAQLSLTFHLVPKVLGPLVFHWVPRAFVISFKLETDESILLQKARGALESYKHHWVIANELHTRKEKVTLVGKSDFENIHMTPEDLAAGIEIEERIVDCLTELHDAFVKSQSSEST
ncbi:phosphopantothenate--cysteine ligase [Galendromus occidentalis]|uniref:Phosphopantothenate--cysteine ligase n=1 Tax=Galendromus occidentalis TaxID=34638 RepID=A0AAJ6VXM6_9ACAR|nr:phosphopantothenate--cysteine ligase [Galendromus occidentalis]